MLEISHCFPCDKESSSSDVEEYGHISITPTLSNVFEKIVAKEVSILWKATV